MQEFEGTDARKKIVFIASYHFSDTGKSSEGSILYELLKEMRKLMEFEGYVISGKVDLLSPIAGVSVFEVDETAVDKIYQNKVSIAASLLFQFRVYRKLREIVNTEEIDLIHRFSPAYFMRSLDIFTLIGPKRREIPFVLGPIFPPWEEDFNRRQPFYQYLSKPFFKVMLDKAAVLYVQTPITGDILAASFPEVKEKILVTTAAVSDDTFQVARYEKRVDRFNILMVGRLIEDRQMDVVVQAIDKLRDHIPGISLEIAGDGPKKVYLQNLIEDLGVGETVKLLGQIPRAEVYERMKNAHLLIDLSAHPPNRVVMEAIACYCSTLILGHPYLKDMFEDGKNTFTVERDLIERKDAQALKQKITEIIKCNKDKLAAIKGQAQKDLAEKFSIQAAARKIVSSYEKILKR